MAGLLKVEIDSNVADFLAQYADGLEPTIQFAMQQARLFLKNDGLPGAVALMSAKAGDGFPNSYRNHLMVAMAELPLSITSLGLGEFEIALSLAPLGGYEDLLLGLHQNAMLASNDNGTFRSFRISTKSQIQRAVLGNYYADGDLLNSRERRIQWWNDAIVGGNAHTMVGANWNWTKPAIRTIDDAWIADNVPTFEQVATARVNEAWLPKGVAPEWTLLEWGSGAGTLPVVHPQNFQENIRQLMNCACNEAIQGALVAFEKLLAERHVVGVKGPNASPYNSAGQFVQYKDLTAISVPNLSNCLALI